MISWYWWSNDIFVIDSKSFMRVINCCNVLTAQNPNLDQNYFWLFISALSKLCLPKRIEYSFFLYALDLNDIIQKAEEKKLARIGSLLNLSTKWVACTVVVKNFVIINHTAVSHMKLIHNF